MLGLTRLKRLAERLLDPQAFVDRLEEARLERMMGFRGQYLAHRDFQVSLLKKLDVAPGKKVLEMGCGPLTVGVPLISMLDTGSYCGVDIRPSVLDAAHRLIGKHELSAKNPRLIYSRDFGRTELPDEKFDYIIAFSVLYHLEDSLVGLLFREIANRLDIDGCCVANINAEHEPSRWLEFPFVKRPVEFYVSCAKSHGVKAEILGQGFELGMSGQGSDSRNYYMTFKLAG